MKLASASAVNKVPVTVKPSTARASDVLNMAGSSCWIACALLVAVLLKLRNEVCELQQIHLHQQLAPCLLLL